MPCSFFPPFSSFLNLAAAPPRDHARHSAVALFSLLLLHFFLLSFLFWHPPHGGLNLPVGGSPGLNATCSCFARCRPCRGHGGLPDLHPARPVARTLPLSFDCCRQANITLFSSQTEPLAGERVILWGAHPNQIPTIASDSLIKQALAALSQDFLAHTCARDLLMIGLPSTEASATDRSCKHPSRVAAGKEVRPYDRICHSRIEALPCACEPRNDKNV